MRNLTIKRNKSFVGCLVKMKVYIEDYASGEIMINNTPCRKIGDLKNGEEKTFLIDENETKVFVIFDKLSKEYCNDFYKIPAGQEDIFLSGKNKYNLASGNAFRFDGVTDEEILQNRKKGSKKGIIILIIAAIVGGIIGFAATFSMLSSSTKPKAKVFSADGMKITLTDQFVETPIAGFTVCYDFKDAAVLALKEKFDLLDGFEDYTLEEYGEAIIENGNFDSSVKLQNKNGLTYFEYLATNSEINETYKYFVVVYKAPDAFWMIQFATPEAKFSNYQQSFIDWARSVEFTK